MKTNTELLNEMEGMFEALEEIQVAVKKETGRELELEILDVSKVYMKFLRETERVELTIKFHEALAKMIQNISLEISYLLPPADNK